MKKSNLMVTVLAAAMAINMTSCAEKPKETDSIETMTAAPETETETEAEEEPTVDETEAPAEEKKLYSAIDMAKCLRAARFFDWGEEYPPFSDQFEYYMDDFEVGETKNLTFFGWEEGGELKGAFADFTMQSLPEWGIEKIALPAGFDLHDPTMLKIEAPKRYASSEGEDAKPGDTFTVDLTDIGEQWLNKWGAAYTDDMIKLPVEDLPWISGGCWIVDPGKDGYVKASEGVRMFDLSNFYPGSYFVTDGIRQFHTWRLKTDLSAEKISELGPDSVIGLLYPYPTLNEVGDKVYVAEGADGYLYVAARVRRNTSEIVRDVDYDCSPSLVGGMIMVRIKDGLAQGYMYLRPYARKDMVLNEALESEANYILNVSMRMDDISMVTGGKVCESLYCQ